MTGLVLMIHGWIYDALGHATQPETLVVSKYNENEMYTLADEDDQFAKWVGKDFVVLIPVERSYMGAWIRKPQSLAISVTEYFRSYRRID